MRCPNCGADVSALREYCPSCGASIHSRLSGEPRSGPLGRPPEELQRNRKTVLIVAAGILIMAVGFGSFRPFGRHLSFGPGHVTIDTDSTPKGPVTIGAAELFEAYHTNSGAADKKFGGREMVVTGEFVRTVPDGYGSIDMRLKTAHPETPLGIDLDGHSVDAATKLEPGQQVTVSCRKVAGTGDDPWLQDCVLQPPAESDTAKPPAPPALPAAQAPPTPPPPSAGR